VISVASMPCTADARSGRPRCTVAMRHPVAALAISPDGTMLGVAVLGAGLTVWRLSEGTLADGIAPAPSTTVQRDEEQRPQIMGAVTWRPDGREIALGLEDRVLRYALPEGRLVRVLPGPGAVIRDVVWWPDGSRLVVTAFDDPAAHVLDADTGRAVARYDVEQEASAIAVESGAETVVVGSVTGTLTRFRTSDGARLDSFSPSSHQVLSLARIDDLLVVLGTDGIIRTLDARDGRLRTSVVVGSTPARIAGGSGGRIAVGLPSSHAVVIDARAGEILRTLTGFGAPILATAWHDRTLVTGDAAGRVMVWDVEP
jgi:cytochrome c